MFKSCGSLFDLSRKLGSVVGGLGLAGVLFSGQVSARGLLWSDDEKQALADVVSDFVREYGNRREWTWEDVARKLFNVYQIVRKPDACRRMYASMPKNAELEALYNPHSSDWSETECLALIRAAAQCKNRKGEVIWKDATNAYNNYIAEHNNSRQTNYRERGTDACRRKYNTIKNLDNVNIMQTRKTFTAEEDAMLRSLVQRLGEDRWNTIALSFPGRTAKQCRHRYIHYIDMPSFTDEEDAKLLDLVNQSGSNLNWNAIAREMRGEMGDGIKFTHCRTRYNQLKDIARRGANRNEINRTVTGGPTDTALLTDSSRANGESETGNPFIDGFIGIDLFTGDGIDTDFFGLNQDLDQSLNLAGDPIDDTALTDSSRANGESQTGNPFIGFDCGINFFDQDPDSLFGYL